MSASRSKGRVSGFRGRNVESQAGRRHGAAAGEGKAQERGIALEAKGRMRHRMGVVRRVKS